MKNFCCSVALMAMLAAPAGAAELPLEAAPALAAAYYDWSGVYLGFNAGGARYDVTHHFPTPGATTPDVTTRRQRRHLRIPRGRAMAVGRLGRRRGSRANCLH
jgi:opacity protein-like surface antigen